jgi:hypothetical protein
MKKDIRYMPSYSVPEAAFYLRLPVSTLRAWLGRQTGFVGANLAFALCSNRQVHPAAST